MNADLPLEGEDIQLRTDTLYWCRAGVYDPAPESKLATVPLYSRILPHRRQHY